jgi:hypothetical protein
MFCYRVALPVVALSLGAASPTLAQEGNQAATDTSAADFKGESASREVQAVGGWVLAARDNHGLPFMIVDKRNAKVFVFNPLGSLAGSAPALLGLSVGDGTVPGIGQRRLATIMPAERTTPAGRFRASLGHDLEQDVLWIDYDSGLSLHRVIVGRLSDHRRERLASPSPLDNRISYGCINVPPAFYDNVVVPAFKGTRGIVYILPDSSPLNKVFRLLSDPNVFSR